MGSNHYLKKITAQSLVEIIIAMTIFAVAVVTITSLNAHNYKVIKNNELADQANQVMLGAVEYFKSPAQSVQEMIVTAGVTSNNSSATFYLPAPNNIIDPSSTATMNWSSQILIVFNSNSQCNDSSLNRVYFKNTSSGSGTDPFIFCMQVDVVKYASGYLITARIMYITSGQPIYNSIIGFRPYTYVEQAP